MVIEAPDDSVPADEPSFMRIEAALARIEQSAQRVRDGERASAAGLASDPAVSERLDRLIARVRAALAVLPEYNEGGLE